MSSKQRNQRILVIANETIDGSELHEAIFGQKPLEALVVTPALNSRLRHWASDEGRARSAAQQRLDQCLDRLRAVGIDAHGYVGDADPLQAIADALRVYEADNIVIATHPEHRSNWLSRNVVDRARQRFGLPVLHVVVTHDMPLTQSRSKAGLFLGAAAVIAAALGLVLPAAAAAATQLNVTVGTGHTISLKTTTGA